MVIVEYLVMKDYLVSF